ncbi:hypothetical protein GQX74_000884 [Glossina fuscipes]|nr:hypothetical protein GQX74_000884 [Glossina fuscipes]
MATIFITCLQPSYEDEHRLISDNVLRVGKVELRGNVSVALTDPLELADVEGPNGKGQSTRPCVTSCSAAAAVTATAGPTATAATSTTASRSATATASLVDYGHLSNAGCSSSTNFLNNSTPSRSSSRVMEDYQYTLILEGKALSCLMVELISDPSEKHEGTRDIRNSVRSRNNYCLKKVIEEDDSKEIEHI